MEYQLKRNSRSRSLKIRLDAAGQVIVSAPAFVPEKEIKVFVNQAEEWVLRQQQRLALRQTANPTLDLANKVVSYLGQLYTIRMGDQGKVRFENGICLVCPVTFDEKDIPRTLIKELKLQAERFIRERAAFWSDRMKTEYQSIGFGQQTSRWGSCSGDNKLTFNWRLVHFSLPVIDYVVIHELAHTVYHDHSDRFWKLVKVYCPTYQEQRQFLKRQIISRI